MSAETITYLARPIWCAHADSWVALPESQASELDHANNDDTRLSKAWDEDVDSLLDAGMILLDEDEDEAARILALRIHLDDWNYTIKTCSYGEHRYEFNPHRKASGYSPAQIIELVQFLKSSLMGYGPSGKPWAEESAVTIMEQNYDKVSRHVQEVAKLRGTHDALNTLYHLCNGDVRYFDAWEGREPADTREWYPTSNGEYWVLTDNEADQAWDDYLENLLDDGDVVPGADSRYFDRDRWKRDARIDGRGHSLASYDGSEHMVNLDDETYYIFRVG